MVSPAVGYAASAMGYLATHGDAPLRVRELAKATGTPGPYLSKIVHDLARKGFLTATKGRGGGVTLCGDARRITLFDLCEALDDDIMHPRCALGTASCSDVRACPAHELQLAVRAKQLAFLKRTTVQQVGEFNSRRDAATNRKKRSAT